LEAVRSILKHGAAWGAGIRWAAAAPYPVAVPLPPPTIEEPLADVPPYLPAPLPSAPLEPKWESFKTTVPVWRRLLVMPAYASFEQAHTGWKTRLADWDAQVRKLGKDDAIARARHLSLSKHQQELHSQWRSVVQGETERYHRALETWRTHKQAWDSAAAEALERLFPKKAAYDRGEAGAVEWVVESVLRHSPYPSAFPNEMAVHFESTAKTMLVALHLPNFDDISLIKVRAGKGVPVTKSEGREVQNEAPLAIAIRTLHEAIAADSARYIDTVSLNGLLRFKDPATGKERIECILSVVATREQVEGIDIAHVNALECFRALNGLAAPELADRVPIAPFMRLDKSDRRIVDERDVVAAAPSGTNLATMEWEDFEHFVRQILEMYFARQGVEVKVTQSSRDRGVDAIAFDPDPLKGGKIVIQAKRYTRVVDVSAVRDLYGTVMNEGANRGILVTTSHFGKDSWDFAKSKPLTLLDGSNLMHLVRQFGLDFRLDINEARSTVVRATVR